MKECPLPLEEAKKVVDLMPKQFDTFEFIEKCPLNDNKIKCIKKNFRPCGYMLGRRKTQLNIKQIGRRRGAALWEKL